MKTKNLFSSLALLFSLGSGSMQAQDKIVLGSSVTTSLSGSGVGLCLSPALVLGLGRSSITAGINFQNRNKAFTGIRGKYEFIVNPEDNCELFLLYDAAYHFSAYLDNQTVSFETFINPENANYYNTVKLKTIEQHMGFGVNVRVCNGIKFFGATGIGFYNTLGASKYAMNLFQYRELKSCSFMIMAGIRIDIKKIK
jgi:hypothetical protein